MAIGAIEMLAQAVGEPTFLGVIVATTTINNADTAVPFSTSGDGLKGKTLLLQASAACHVLPVSSAAGTVTTANGVKLAADVLVTMHLATKTHLAAVGAASVKVWELA